MAKLTTYGSKTMGLRYVVIAVIAVAMLALGYLIGYTIVPRPPQQPPTTITITTIVEKPVVVERPTIVTLTAPISVIDALGRVVIFNEVPKRVVSLAPSITEILFALGLGDRVVGVTSYCNHPSQVLKLVEEGKITVIGGYWNPDVEKIIALRPDLVIGSAGTRPHLAIKERLEEIEVNMLYVKGADASDDKEVFIDIAIIAKVFGVEDRAQELINDISSEINYVRKKLVEHNITMQKVLVLLGPPAWGLWSAGGDTFLGWVISSAGGINIAQRFSGWPQLSYEYILAENPDVIIVTGMGTPPENILKDIEGTPLKETKAFKEGRVYIVDQEAGDILVRPGPRIGKAVKLMAQILYPGIFGKPAIPTVYKP